MQVILRKTWFAQSRRFRSRNGEPVDIPDSLRDRLPPGARIVGERFTADTPKSHPPMASYKNAMEQEVTFDDVPSAAIDAVMNAEPETQKAAPKRGPKAKGK